MPKCLNDSSKRFTGYENTPKGKGYVASSEKVGKRMKGTDGDMYVVTKSGKNKRWSKMVKRTQMSPMNKRSRKRRVKKRVTVEEYSDEDDYSDDYSDYSEDDEDDIEWKLEAAEDRCKLSDVFCTESLLVNVALLAWTYFKDWYRRVQYGEDPYEVYEDLSLLK